MRWIGPLLHLLYPPKHDAHGAELARLLDGQRMVTADIAATRARLEAVASREAALDDIAGERG